VTESAPKDAVIRFLFELGYGWTSLLIGRFGLPIGGWSHVRPILDDGSSIDSYEGWIYSAPEGWGVSGFPQSIAPGVAHRPPNFRKVKASALVVIPVTSEQKAKWLKFLWAGADAHLAYDFAAIENYILGGNRPAKNSDICSAWARQSARNLWLGHPSNVLSREVSPDMFYALTQEAYGGTVIVQKGTPPAGASGTIATSDSPSPPISAVLDSLRTIK
jgi:hypothetical protein